MEWMLLLLLPLGQLVSDHVSQEAEETNDGTDFPSPARKL
jgi:hypothetical protein